MDRLQSMRVFCQVASTGSFTRAATELNMSAPVLSRLVIDLEQHLRTRLFNRTTRSVKLTEAGHEYLLRCQHILEQIDEADTLMSDQGSQASGTLRLLVSFTGGMHLLAPHLIEFRRQYPDVLLEVHLAERVVDLVAEGFDIAIQPRPYVFSSSAIVRKLMQARMIMVAAPSYVAQRGLPATPDDLSAHDCVSPAHEELRDYWQLNSDSEMIRAKPHNVLVSNNLKLLLDAIRSGMGIGLVYRRLVTDELAAGTLVHVLPAFRGEEMDYFIVYPSRKYVPPKVRAMIGFLQALFERHPDV